MAKAEDSYSAKVHTCSTSLLDETDVPCIGDLHRSFFRGQMGLLACGLGFNRHQQQHPCST